MVKSIKSQIKKINIDKWNEGCRLKMDPGREYVIAWIEKNAAWFREAWNKSKCKCCHKWEECGYQVKEECDVFSKE
jgi:hypothetical protein